MGHPFPGLGSTKPLFADPPKARCYPPRMPIVVQKYGGTSVGDTHRIRGVADRIVRAREQGQDVVVVVSAMGETTDDLLDKASDITPVPEPRELDMLLTAGERIAMSLLAIAVNARGCRRAFYTRSPGADITHTPHRDDPHLEGR